MLYYKNNYSQAVDCWVNGEYQGVIPAHTIKYMPVEGFVTPDSRWLPDGTLYQKRAYGGWSPSSPAEVVTVAITGIGEPVVYWKGTFAAPGSGGGYSIKAYNMMEGGKPIDDLDIEFAQGMPKGDPKDLKMLLAGKNFAPEKDLDGASSDGTAMTAMKQSSSETPGGPSPRLVSGNWSLSYKDNTGFLKEQRFAFSRDGTFEFQEFFENGAIKSTTIPFATILRSIREMQLTQIEDGRWMRRAIGTWTQNGDTIATTISSKWKGYGFESFNQYKIVTANKREASGKPTLRWDFDAEHLIEPGADVTWQNR